MHNGVGDEAYLENVVNGALCLVTELLKQLVQGVTNSITHLRGSLGVHHHIGNPTHQIFAKTNLRVHDACRSKYRASIEITQVRSHGCRTDVNSDSSRSIIQSRPDADDGLLIMQGDSDSPFPFDECPLQGR